MTTQIIFSIVIVFFILYSSRSSSALKEEENGIYHKNASDNINTKATQSADSLDNERTTTERQTVGGDFCNETLVCFIVQPSIAQIPVKGIENLTDVCPQKLMGFAECLPGCRAAKCNSTCNITTPSSNETVTYCWISIHSPCNIAKFSFWDFLLKNKYYVTGGAAIVIILLTMIICICCILRRKKKLLATKEIAGSYEMFTFSDIPLQSRYPEYMEDNSIYS